MIRADDYLSLFIRGLLEVPVWNDLDVDVDGIALPRLPRKRPVGG